MCGKKLKSSVLLLALALSACLPSLASADVTLTQSEFNELCKELESSKQALQQAQQLLNLSPEQLQNLSQLDSQLQQLHTQSQEQQTNLQQLLKESTKHSESLTKLRGAGLSLGVDVGVLLVPDNGELKLGFFAGIGLQF